MPPLSELLIGGVLPGVISLALLVAPWLIWRGGRGQARAALMAAWIAPIAMAISFLPATLVSNKHAMLWPVNASERGLAVVAVALGAALLSLLLARAFRRGPMVGRVVAASMPAVAGAFAAYALLKPLHPHAVPMPMFVGLIVGSGLWVAISSRLLGAASTARPGAIVPALLSIGLFGASLVMLFSAIGVFAQATGGLVAAMSSATLIGLWKRSHSLDAAAFVVPLSVLAYFLIGAWQLSPRPPLGSLAIIAAMPLVFAAVATLLITGQRGRLILGLVAASLYVGGAVAWGYSIYAASQSESDYGY